MRGNGMTHRRLASGLGLCALVFVSGSCQTASQPSKSAAERNAQTLNGAGAPRERVTDREQIDQLVNAYADRYMTLIGGACDEVKKQSLSPEARRLAQLFKLTGVSSVYDVATNADPFTKLLDTVLVVTLQNAVWVDDNKAEEVFGEQSMILIEALYKARQDIWALAERVLTPEELLVLDRLIKQWRDENQSVSFVAYVRFDDFAASRGKSLIERARSGGGFLAPVDEAKRAVDDARLLAERIFFYSKRLPILAGWEIESVVDEVFAKPEVASSLSGYEDLAKTAGRAVDAIEKLPGQITAEREAIVRDLETRAETLKSALESYREAVTDTQGLVKDVQGLADSSERIVASLNEIVKGVDTLAARFEKKPGDAATPGAGFQIEEYARAAERMAVTVRELNALVASTSGLVQSEAWKQRLAEVDRMTTAAGGGLIDRAFTRGLVLMVAFFVLLLGYRWLSAKVGRG